MKIQTQKNTKANALGHMLKMLLLTATLSALIILPACTTSDPVEESTDPKLNVTVGDGVLGVPETGDYYYEPGTVVEYQYTLDAQHTDLEVLLDDEEAAASGTITMNEDHVLRVSAQSSYDIVGTWEMSEEYNDGSSFEVRVTFTGTKEEGTVTDDQGGTGTYTINEYHYVEFTLDFPEVKYKYGGYFDGSNEISGTCERETPANIFTGTFSATRTTQAPTRVSKANISKNNLNQSKMD